MAWLVADGETPIRGEYDLIIANATFQWFTRPKETLAALYRNLAPGARPGLLPWAPVLSGTGRGPNRAARSLNSLRSRRFPLRGLAMGRPVGRSISGRIPPGPAGPGNGHRHLPFGQGVSKALQATGATNPRPYPFSPRLLRALMAAYETDYGRDGAIPVSYDMIWAVAEKS